MNKKVSVVIPIYKVQPDEYELVSFNQCLRILNRHTICLVTHQNLDISYYTSILNDIQVSYHIEYFEKKYFENVTGYNRLLLSCKFYGRFRKYKYMLIYQLDAYVFRDELDFWCDKGYDYIGGIWFDNFGTPQEGKEEWLPGNGGVSLRNIESMYQLLGSRKPIKGIKSLLQKVMQSFQDNKKRAIISLFALPLNLIGYRNNTRYLAKRIIVNEDHFIVDAVILHKKKIPDVKDAILFSWDRSPEFLYDKYKKLPFICHAWHREDLPYQGNYKFWKTIIEC